MDIGTQKWIVFTTNLLFFVIMLIGGFELSFLTISILGLAVSLLLAISRKENEFINWGLLFLFIAPAIYLIVFYLLNGLGTKTPTRHFFGSIIYLPATIIGLIGIFKQKNQPITKPKLKNDKENGSTLNGFFISLGITILSAIVGGYLMLLANYGSTYNDTIATLSLLSPLIIFLLGMTIAYFKTENKTRKGLKISGIIFLIILILWTLLLG